MTAAAAALALLAAAAAGRPDWVDGMPAAYPRDRFVVATGTADDRASAEVRARAGVAAFFESRVTGRTEVREEEASARAGKVELRAAALAVRSEAAAATQKLLEGVEIADAWTDPAGRIFALAVLDRARAAEALRRRLADLDAEAAALTARLAAEPARFPRARLAHRLLAAAARRAPVADDLRLLDPATEPAPAPGVREARAAAERALGEVAVAIRAAGPGAEPAAAAATRAVLGTGMRAVTAGAPHDVAAEITVEAAEPAVADGWVAARLTARVHLRQGEGKDALTSFLESAKGTSGRAEEATRRAAEALGARVEERLAEELRARLEAP